MKKSITSPRWPAREGMEVKSSGSQSTDCATSLGVDAAAPADVFRIPVTADQASGFAEQGEMSSWINEVMPTTSI